MTKKQKDIKALIDITKPLGTIDRFIELFASKLSLSPDLLKKISNVLMSEENMKELHVEVAKVYDVIFTHKEVKDAIKFYKSSSGKSMVKKMPVVAIQVSDAAQAWGKNMFNKHINDIGHVISEDISRERQELDDYQKKAEFLNSRMGFVQKYVADRGWDINNLTPEQVQEIREQKEWKE